MERRDSSFTETCENPSLTMKKETIQHVLQKGVSLLGETVKVEGWARSFRDQKNFFFLQINDGSCFASLQIVFDSSLENLSELKEHLSIGASVSVEGEIVSSPGKGQAVEMKATTIAIIGLCPKDEYPLQKKRHSFEFLRTIAHLRARTNTQGAVARVRSHAAGATHQFFQERGFLFLPTPILTGSDCEGGGDLFRVTTLDPQKKENPEEDFFKKKAFLTVSGQLNAESYACALSKVYTFGPTFRAENSNTYRHLAEFWMIEPEVAFCDLTQIIHLAEEYIQFVLQKLFERSKEDLLFFDQFIENGLLERLEKVVSEPFLILSYTEAISILQKAEKKFEFEVKWGEDLKSEQEKYLAEEYAKKPVVITDYPKEIKAFYMRENEDQKTVAAFDILVPKIGELIGGSQREERLSFLEKKMESLHLDKKEYAWYLELRKFGTVPHAGFGLGFERFIQFCTGIENIRDVNPFPRYPGHLEF